MKADVTWMRDGIFLGTSDGHAVLMEVPEDGAVSTVAPSPMDMLLIAAGGCTSYDVVQLLQEAGQEVLDCKVTLTSSVENEDPKVLANMHVHYHLSGSNLNRELVESAVTRSQEIYSGALITLGRVTKFTTEIQISEV